MIFDYIEDVKTFGIEGLIPTDTLMIYECSKMPIQMRILIFRRNDTSNF
jgi:hypothetical protein